MKWTHCELVSVGKPQSEPPRTGHWIGQSRNLTWKKPQIRKGPFFAARIADPPETKVLVATESGVLDAMLCYSRWLNFGSSYRVSRTRSGIVQSAVPLLPCMPDKRKGSIPARA